MKRNQAFHETLIPLLVEGIGARSYLEFGTHQNETIGKVNCKRRFGVDTNPVEIPGVKFFKMTTQEFISKKAESLAPFDFVFIDADHSFGSAACDFYGIAKHVSPEGLVCLHDTNPETWADTEPGLCGDSWRLSKQLFRDGYEAVTLPYHPGLTIVRMRAVWGPSR